MGGGKRWRKSSYSGSQSACVEVGGVAAVVRVRDSKDRSAVLRFRREQWRSFVADLKRRESPFPARRIAAVLRANAPAPFCSGTPGADVKRSV
ncbi:MAG: DUF397 domain-containing protein [Saccharopolyspora sp.]|nr:DUF397 domain-containing protein [Saccharopolyspora sp. HNM0986]MBQ6641498.1 DUF397 domain-containing protein [Saccharopolyspora sp.]